MAQVLTNVGKTQILSYLLNRNFPTLYLGWGTGAGTSSATDTSLFTEDSGGSPPYGRVTVAISTVTVNTNLDTIQMTGSIQSNGSKTITNAGIFDASTSGNLLWKTDFSGFALTVGVSLSFTFDWTIT